MGDNGTVDAAPDDLFARQFEQMAEMMAWISGVVARSIDGEVSDLDEAISELDGRLLAWPPVMASGPICNS